jgi:flavin-dependent dehydrogenase
MAFGLGLARHPASPRRWAIGAYFSGVADCAVERPGEQPAVLGEMHVRRDGYIGVAPVPGGATNVCLVTPSHAGDRRFQDPGVSALLMGTLAADPLLAARFADARLLAPPVVLGPLAVDVADRALDGLLLTGDAAGFIDPMTGDGLRFAIRGGELAGLAALRALEHGWSGVHAWHRAERTASFAGKWRFNRALRAVVGSPAAIEAAAVGARMVPAAMRAIVARAGDC